MTPPQALDCPPPETDGDGTVQESTGERVVAARLLAERGRRISDSEARRALSDLDCSERERAVVEALARRLVAGVLAGPAARAATAEEETVARTAIELFEESSHSTT